MADRRARLPEGWETTAGAEPAERPSNTDDYEYVPLRLPPDVTRVSASMRLAIQAEFGGWELSRVRLYRDGSRAVLLKRRKTSAIVAEPGI